MPRKRSDLSITSIAARRARSRRAAESLEKREIRLAWQRYQNKLTRSQETPTERESRLNKVRTRQVLARASESPMKRELRLSADRARHARERAATYQKQRGGRSSGDDKESEGQCLSGTDGKLTMPLANICILHKSSENVANESHQQTNLQPTDDYNVSDEQCNLQLPDNPLRESSGPEIDQ